MATCHVGNDSVPMVPCRPHVGLGRPRDGCFAGHGATEDASSKASTET